ncbi:MAG: hypothetical protein ACI9MR_000398 [Myxococcota bacterium]|jgi:hypothetical protein
MHKAVANDVLRKADWNEGQIRMALRIIAYDGAHAADQIADVIAVFASRSEAPSEQRAWEGIVAKLRDAPRQAEALWALRGF